MNLQSYVSKINDVNSIVKNAGKFSGKQRIDMIYTASLLMHSMSKELDALANRLRQAGK